jgi:MarR family transcriptional regulator, organic hydroperoxide resistance regulator
MPKPLRETLSHTLARTCKAHRGLAGTVLAQVGLYPGQEMILVELWEGDRLTQTEIAERLGVQAPTVTKMLQRMEEAGWVERYACPGDSRATRVVLTERGRALKAQVESAWSELEERTLDGLTEEERQYLQALLSRLRGNLEGEEKKG